MSTGSTEKPSTEKPSTEKPSTEPRRAIVEQVMGMPISIHARGPGADDNAVESAIGAGLAGLRHVDEVFSTWRPDSPVSRLRRGEITLERCPDEVATVLDLCEQARQQTGGWFDAELDDGTGTRRLDPTGLVKGWAVEQALLTIVAALRSAGLDRVDVCLNAGGDVAVHRADGSARPWLIGVEDPADRSRLIAAVPLDRGGLATSGNAARGAHIIDPFTGRRVHRKGSVSVYGPSLMWADVYATAAFARGPGCADWLVKLPGWPWEGWAAIVVGADGSLTEVSPGGGAKFGPP
jgi:thiamine biosynthesis lipoprotein